MLEPMVSQPVAGTENVTIYPYIRKIDLMSSNSYILEGENQIALIDPGGLDDQIDHLEREIARLQKERHRPIVIFLTHVHLDHWIQLKQSRSRGRLGEAMLAVHEAGAICLEIGDSKATLAEHLGRQMMRVPVSMKLLSSKDKAIGGCQSLDMGGWNFDYVLQSMSADGLSLHSQIVPLGRKDQLEIYHIPGHSPDSICMHIGSILIVGDLFFAPNPGMAGAYGWSQKDLMESIRKVLWILENRNIIFCCSGHGRPIDAKTAKKTLEVMYRDVAALKGIEEISPEWIKQTASYAQDLMGELERVFTIIAGRLAFIAHVLAELEEMGEAEELESILKADILDDMFSDFNHFAGELHQGKKLDWELVHKAGQIVGRLDRLFEREKLGSVLDQSLMNRAGRLLSDYSVTYRGFRPPYYVEYVDINELIGGILEHVRHNPHEDMAILEAESDEDYLKALKTRIAHINLFEDVSLIFEPDLKKPSASMDKERFSDALIDILERFVGVGASEIKITTAMNDDWSVVQVAGSGNVSCNPVSRKSQRFFERNLSLCGGLMQTAFKDNSPTVDIEFYSQENDWEA